MNEYIAVGLTCALLSACSENSPTTPANERDQRDDTESSPADDAEPESLDEVTTLPGTALSFDVPEQGRVYLDLSEASIIEPDDPSTSTEWDLAFEAWTVFTNSGPSGPGVGAAFGPNDELDILFDEAPNLPFLRSDLAGGAFGDWYAYDGATHSLWSRHHVYGVQRGDALWKLQILGYYGEVDGAPVSGIYSVRYARLEADSIGELVTLSIDGTAGGAGSNPDAPSGCLDLEQRRVRQLSLEELAEDRDWDLCFRRDSITTNGGAGGPGDVRAVNLDASLLADETLTVVKQRTAESEQARFDAVDHDAATDPELEYRLDGPVSVFSDNWYERDGDEAEPVRASWFVRDAEGERNYLIVFRSIEPRGDGAGTLEIQIRSIED